MFHELQDMEQKIQYRHISLKKPNDMLEIIVQYGDEGMFVKIRVAYQILLATVALISSKESSFILDFRSLVARNGA